VGNAALPSTPLYTEALSHLHPGDSTFCCEQDFKENFCLQSVILFISEL
jgi:hypothetical protein